MQRPLDIIAVSLSGLCAIHCLFTPLALILFPVIAGSLFASEDFHLFMLWVILPTSGLAIALGCRNHKDIAVLLLGLGGLSLLIVSAFWGHTWVGETGERLLTLAGGLIMATGHVRNYRLCRNNHCRT